MDFLDRLAERRIADALERGELDDLPGVGAPLPSEDLDLVPAELRSAYRLLRNAGFVPPQLETLRSIAELEGLIAASDDPQLRGKRIRRLQLLWQRLEERHPGARSVRAYREQLLHRAERREP
jgi:hypothetical protein